ncbi:hypothetical protein RUND412_008157 [Rhizina undulata]
MLIVESIPGPNSPQNIQLFLAPLIEELKLLESGVSYYDAVTESTFTLHSYTLLVTGDLPALIKFMDYFEHNSTKGCRFCKISGFYAGHVYFPHSPPKDAESPCETYNWKEPPLRSHKGIVALFRQLAGIENKAEHQRVATAHGIHGNSKFQQLDSIHWIFSWPIDIMHHLLEGIVKFLWHLWHLWTECEGEEFYLSPELQAEIGKELNTAGKDLPSFFGRKPKDLNSGL